MAERILTGNKQLITNNPDPDADINAWESSRFKLQPDGERKGPQLKQAVADLVAELNKEDLKVHDCGGDVAREPEAIELDEEIAIDLLEGCSRHAVLEQLQLDEPSPQEFQRVCRDVNANQGEGVPGGGVVGSF